MLAARWRKQVTPDAPAYPRFAAIEDALFKAHRHLWGGPKNPVPAISVVNMMYVNLVYPENTKTVVQDYFTPRVRVDVLESANAVHELMLSSAERDSIDLRMHLQAVTAQLGDQDASGFRLATAGRHQARKSNDAHKALVRVHDRLQLFFRDLLSPRAKTEWGLKEAM